MQDSDSKIRLIAVGFAFVQILLIFILGYTPYPDSQGYILLATDALNKGEFYPVSTKIRELAFLWNVGSINAVELSLKLFESILPLQITYALLKGASLYLTYRIAKEMVGEKVAWVAVVLYVLYPANYGESTSVLSEIPFIFFVLAALFSFLRGSFLLSGVLFACADYFRPVAIVFLFALVLCYLFEHKTWIKTVAAYIVSLLIIGGLHLYTKDIFFCKAQTGWMSLVQYHWDNDSEKDFDNPNKVCDNESLTFNQKDSVWQSMFIDWISIDDNKKEYLRQIPIKFVKTYISDNVNICPFLSDEEKNSDYMYDSLSMASMKNDFPRYSFAQWLCLYNLLFYYAILILTLIGMTIYYNKDLRFAIYTIIIGTLFILFFGHGEARFHTPYMPLFLIISAYTLAAFRSKKNRNDEDGGRVKRDRTTLY